MINNPIRWPAFSHVSSALLAILSTIKECKLVFEFQVANRGAFLIAQSALRPSFAQSYVARGPPLWLYELFDVERTLTSL
ncbi:hypothetical protein F2Q70_00030732 [Brassica cretica]|uniref:Uncharacterized protein n=1 Tax=Brassica cretica TaxID=69181 RepID=A0A8S9FRC5_BRACR|nr:hypothetical protein F2Q70_00030732 [Brassica cretica]